jgi:hypothetical protein
MSVGSVLVSVSSCSSSVSKQLSLSEPPLLEEEEVGVDCGRRRIATESIEGDDSNSN